MLDIDYPDIEILNLNEVSKGSGNLVIPFIEGEEEQPEEVKIAFELLNIDKSILDDVKIQRGELELVGFEHKGYDRIFLFNLGKGKDIKSWKLIEIFPKLIKFFKRYRREDFSIVLPSEIKIKDEVFESRQIFFNFALSVFIGSFKVEDFKSKDKDNDKDEVNIKRVNVYVLPFESGDISKYVLEGSIVGEGMNVARYLAELPPNVLYPESFVEKAVSFLPEEIEYEVWDEKRIESEELGGVIAVSKGSDNPPRLLILRYAPKTFSKSIVLVGKGVTFDSGGINLKPTNHIEDMKYDMSGASSVLGLTIIAAKEKLPLKITTYIPLVENMPSGKATKPGDIIKMASGKYVEIGNTDAEGRLILADALYLGSKEKPDAMFDLATLTGAIIIALGYEAIGVMGNNEELLDKVRVSGNYIGERVWELPLWDEYRDYLKSEIADINNVGGRAGGSITAGMFLKEFVGDVPWVHLDIAGTAWYEKNKEPFGKRATGAGIRVLYEFMKRSL